MPSPTDQQLLDSYRNALNALAFAQSYTLPDGRVMTKASLPEIRETIAWLEQRIAAAQNPGDASGIIVVTIV